MNSAVKIRIYKAQVENVRLLNKALSEVSRSLNSHIRRDNSLGVKVDTRILTILYCAWCEASFSKLIHTPYAFSDYEISQIKSEAKGNIQNGWDKCLQLAFARTKHSPKSNFIPNAKQKIRRAIKENVIDLSIYRNKFAHGQFIEALNRENTRTDPGMTQKIDSLDPIKILFWQKSQQFILEILEHLVESPNRYFQTSYHINITALDTFCNKCKDWTLESKKIKLLKKIARR